MLFVSLCHGESTLIVLSQGMQRRLREVFSVQLGHRLVRRWDLIDQMFDEDEKTVKALEGVLQVDSMEKAVEFKKEYGEFWAGWVLCAAIFRWCEMCNGEISEEGLNEIWNQSRSYWRDVALAVDQIRWDNWEKEKKT